MKRVIEKKQEEEDKVYSGLACFKDGVRQIPIESIPGVLEAGYKVEIWYKQPLGCFLSFAHLFWCCWLVNYLVLVVCFIRPLFLLFVSVLFIQYCVKCERGVGSLPLLLLGFQ